MKRHIHKVTLHATAGTGWNAVQEQLESATNEVRHLAMADKRHGILVTRHQHDAFTVALSPDVPYGMTYEREGHPQIGGF